MADNKLIQFIKTTVMGGLLFLVPLGFLGFILYKAFGFMMLIAEPMADLLPVDTIGGVALANLIAVIAIVLVSFLAGLLGRSKLASSAVRGLESRILMKIPGYSVVKGIKGGFDREETGVSSPLH